MASVPRLHPALVGLAVAGLIAVAATVAAAHGGTCDVKSWPGIQNFEAPLATKDTPSPLPPPVHRILSPGRPIRGAPTPASLRATPTAAARASVPDRPIAVQPSVPHESVTPRAAAGLAASSTTVPAHVAPAKPTDPAPTPSPIPPGPPAKDVAPTTMTPRTAGRAPPPPSVPAIPDTPVLGPLFRGAAARGASPSMVADHRK